MTSPKTFLLDNVIKNQDLTLTLEIPLGQSESCNSSPSISLGPVKIPLATSTAPGPISGVFTKDSLTGNSPLLDTTGDQVP